MFTKASLTSLLFGKAETVSIVKDLGIDEIKPTNKNDFTERKKSDEILPDEAKNKNSENSETSEKSEAALNDQNSDKPTTSSKVKARDLRTRQPSRWLRAVHRSLLKATLQKIYEKHPHLAPKKVDGLEIEGLKRIKVVEKKDEKDEFEKSEDWVLQRLFKKAGAVVDSGTLLN